VDELQTKAA
jgi:ATP-dependent RNA helicase DOB1